MLTRSMSMPKFDPVPFALGSEVWIDQHGRVSVNMAPN